MGIAATLGELGPVGFASYATGRLLERVPGLAWHRYRLIAVPRTGMPAMPRGHSATVLDEMGIVHHAAMLDLPRAAIRHRLRQGMSCIAAWRGERLLGVNWLTEGAFEEDEVAVRFVPPPGCAWDTGLFVCPAERGGRAFAALWAGSADWMAARGLEWSLSRIADHNVASWRSHCRMGGRAIGSVAALSVGGRQWVPGRGFGPAELRLRVPE